MKSKKQVEGYLKNTYKMVEMLNKCHKSKMKEELLYSYRSISHTLEWVLEK